MGQAGYAHVSLSSISLHISHLYLYLYLLFVSVADRNELRLSVVPVAVVVVVVIVFAAVTIVVCQKYLPVAICQLSCSVPLSFCNPRKKAARVMTDDARQRRSALFLYICVYTRISHLVVCPARAPPPPLPHLRVACNISQSYSKSFSLFLLSTLRAL